MNTVALFVQSKPGQHAILEQVKELLAANISISQVFFYYEGVLHVHEPYVAEWQALLPQCTFAVCSQYAEKYQITHFPENFTLQGLVSFFAEHSQRQSRLIQL